MPTGESAIASAFRGMPAPETFKSFIYEGDATISVSTKCADEYSVIMIFPVDAETVFQSTLTMKEEKYLKLDVKKDTLPKEGDPVKLVLEVAK